MSQPSQEKPRFGITWRRTVPLGDFHSLQVSAFSEFYRGEISEEEARKQVARMVREAILAELASEHELSALVDRRWKELGVVPKPSQPQRVSQAAASSPPQSQAQVHWRSTRSGEEVVDVASAQRDQHLKDVLMAARAHITQRTTDDVFSYRLWKGNDRELLFREPKARRRSPGGTP